MGKKRGSNNKTKIVTVIDTETTGLPPDGEIIEIGAIKYSYRNGKYKVIDTFSRQVRPHTEFFSERAYKAHGIALKSLKYKQTVEEVLPKFLDFINSRNH